tara:strand:+ start:2738 stop:3385 length:648 start_codon:yes stop_codon:yes gene_type:complete
MYNIFFLLKTFLRIIYYLFSNEKRYVNLILLILKNKPKKILEVGVYNGRRALQMIEAAKIFNKDIEYYGFDLFEDLTKNQLTREESKQPNSMKEIITHLSKHAKINLFKGYTKNTLKKFLSSNKSKIDFCFIDGGHTIQTIENDYKYCSQISKKNSLIVFDDYYTLNVPNTNKFGSNKIYNYLNKINKRLKLLPFEDTYYQIDKQKKIKMFYVVN